MHKLFSELIGLSVLDSDSRSRIDIVRDVIIDPENGKLLAFILRGNNVVVPFDIENLSNEIFINDRSHIIPISDVLRVNKVFKMHMPIIGAKVITERSKAYIGRVFDYEIDANLMVLTKIYVAKTFFFFHVQERIISYRDIVKINKHTIIVKDSRALTVKEKAEVKAQSTAFA